MPSTPPTIPIALKLAGVANIPMPMNTFSMLNAVYRDPTLPVMVPSPLAWGAWKSLILILWSVPSGSRSKISFSLAEPSFPPSSSPGMYMSLGIEWFLLRWPSINSSILWLNYRLNESYQSIFNSCSCGVLLTRFLIKSPEWFFL